MEYERFENINNNKVIDLFCFSVSKVVLDSFI